MLNELSLLVSVIYFIFLALILTAVLGILVKEKNNRNLFLFILFFIVNPGTITMLAGDFGRFDLFMIIIALLCIVSIAVKKLEWCIPVLFILGILIHEAFVFMYAPLILAVLLFSALYGQKRIYGISVLIVSIITLTGSYAAVFLFGNASGIGYERFVSSVQLRAGFKIEERMINMEYFYSLKDHLDYLLTRLKDPAFSLNFIAALIILIPTFVLFFKVWAHVFRNNKDRKAIYGLMCLSCAGVFALFIIGVDYGRWLSIFMFANFLAIFFLIYKGIINMDEVVERFSKPAMIFYLAVMILYAIIGPMSVMAPFPFVNEILNLGTVK
jgi:hypothetical protein